MPDTGMVERLRKPAVKVSDVVFSLIDASKHHYELYEHLAHLGVLPDEPCQAETGWLTSEGRFVNAAEAVALRRAALTGQG